MGGTGHARAWKRLSITLDDWRHHAYDMLKRTEIHKASRPIQAVWSQAPARDTVEILAGGARLVKGERFWERGKEKTSGFTQWGRALKWSYKVITNSVIYQRRAIADSLAALCSPALEFIPLPFLCIHHFKSSRLPTSVTISTFTLHLWITWRPWLIQLYVARIPRANQATIRHLFARYVIYLYIYRAI